MELNELMAAMRKTASPKPILVDKVPQWGTLYVKPQTVEEVDAQSDEKKDEEGSKKRRLARAAARVICNEQGVRMFDENNAEHLSLLAEQPWELLQKVLAAVGIAGEKEDPEGKKPDAASS